ncbi:MAG: hypothetical protein RSD41_05875, partial [Kiritimatiellia bacterium]
IAESITPWQELFYEIFYILQKPVKSSFCEAPPAYDSDATTPKNKSCVIFSPKISASYRKKARLTAKELVSRQRSLLFPKLSYSSSVPA